MRKARSDVQTLDSHQTIALCRDSLRVFASLLGSLRGDLFDDHQRQLLRDVCDLADGAQDELQKILGQLGQGLASALDELLADDAWEHPDHVFPPARPRLDLSALLGHCRQRLTTATDTERRRLESVQRKLEIAVEAASEARQTFGLIRRPRQSSGGRGGKPP